MFVNFVVDLDIFNKSKWWSDFFNCVDVIIMNL